MKLRILELKNLDRSKYFSAGFVIYNEEATFSRTCDSIKGLAEYCLHTGIDIEKDEFKSIKGVRRCQSPKNEYAFPVSKKVIQEFKKDYEQVYCKKVQEALFH